MLDHGPLAGSFNGGPCLDLDGNRRQRDWNGDGLAVRDIGACEHRNGGLAPGAVANLRWTSRTRLTWNPTPGAASYHIYRDALSSLGYGAFGVCRDELDTNPADERLDDLQPPAASAGFFYLITAESAGGQEGSAGEASCTERSVFNSCP